jgi:hypothetical protein
MTEWSGLRQYARYKASLERRRDRWAWIGIAILVVGTLAVVVL